MRAIDFLVPDIPESLAITVKREQYLGKQALVDHQTAMLVSAGYATLLVNSRSNSIV